MNEGYYSDVPISAPLFFPGEELKAMNGFTFTHSHGIVLQYNSEERVNWESLLR